MQNRLVGLNLDSITSLILEETKSPIPDILEVVLFVTFEKKETF